MNTTTKTKAYVFALILKTSLSLSGCGVFDFSSSEYNDTVTARPEVPLPR